MTIYKSFIRPHFIIILDYDNVVYDRAFNDLFHQSLESLQYSAAMSITGGIRGTSSVKIFQELKLETLKSRRWLRKLYLCYKLVGYLFQLIPENNTSYSTRSAQKCQIPIFKTIKNLLKSFLFLQL